MPGLQFDNRISWMDIVAIIGAAVSALYIIFGHGAKLDKLKLQVRHNIEAIKRVEYDSREGDKNIIEQIEKVRQEQGARFDKLDKKLDRLVDRELHRGQ